MTLTSEITKISREFDGEAAVYVKDLATGVRCTHNGATPFYLASVVKVPVMITAFQLVDAGSLSLDEELEVTKDDLRDGSHEVRQAGRFAMRELIRLMMTHSDNGATDLVLKRIGIESVNAMLGRAGIDGFRELTTMLEVRRRVFGGVDSRGATLSPAQYYELWAARSMTRRGRLLGEYVAAGRAFRSREIEAAFDAYYATEANSAPVEAVGALLEALVSGRLASPASTAVMLEIMKQCETGRRRLTSGLQAAVPLAHKTGTQHRRACDAGILYVQPDRPVVVVVCTKSFVELGDAERVMAKVGKKVYDLLATAAAAAAPAPTSPMTAPVATETSAEAAASPPSRRAGD